MGTRNLTCVFVDGEHKIAQYGQFDGYPDGQGKTALAFVRNMLSLKGEQEFIERCNKLKWLEEEELKELWGNAGLPPNQKWASLDVAKKFQEVNPGLSRNAAAEILELVYSGKVTTVRDDLGFAKDGLFCEWAYVVDMDSRQFEVYKGFSTTPETPPGRFAHMYEEGRYYPIFHVKTYHFNSLPMADEFVEEIYALTRDPEDE